MSKLEIFKASTNDSISIGIMNRKVSEFISNKSVASTDVVVVGKYLLIYVWYSESEINLTINLEKDITEFNKHFAEVSERIEEGKSRMEKKREKFDKEFGR